jgi:small acid-soluble spore protein L
MEVNETCPVEIAEQKHQVSIHKGMGQDDTMTHDPKSKLENAAKKKNTK